MESGDKGSLTYGKLQLAGDDPEANLDSSLSNVLLRAGLVLYRGQQGRFPEAATSARSISILAFKNFKPGTQRLGIGEDRNRRG
jgi:hypothetical protein